MSRWFWVGAALAVLLSGAEAQSKLAADFDVAPYLANPSRGGIEEGGPFAFQRANAICERAAEHPPLPDVPFFRAAGWKARCIDRLTNQRSAVGKTAARLICEVRYVDAAMLAYLEDHAAPDARRFLETCEPDFRTSTRAGRFNSERWGGAPPADSARKRYDTVPRKPPAGPPARPYPSPAIPKTPVSPPPSVVAAPKAPPAVPAKMTHAASQSEPSPFLTFLLFLTALGVLASTYARSRARAGGRPDRSSEGWIVCPAPRPSAPGSGRAVDMPRTANPAMQRSNLPSQEGWAQRASAVSNPVSGFVFTFQARANARALDEEQKRMKKARGMTKEYSGMLKDLVEGEEAATAYALRHDLADTFYEHERLKLQEQFDEFGHRRHLAGKRRDKEMIESDTRRIEAQHEQEALERFKDAKFQAGFARFEAMRKERLVGAATADAAIAETKVLPEPQQGNQNNEVEQLYALLQLTTAAIEDGEQHGRDTQELRERAALYKKLLNLT